MLRRFGRQDPPLPPLFPQRRGQPISALGERFGTVPHRSHLHHRAGAARRHPDCRVALRHLSHGKPGRRTRPQWLYALLGRCHDQSGGRFLSPDVGYFCTVWAMPGTERPVGGPRHHPYLDLRPRHRQQLCGCGQGPSGVFRPHRPDRRHPLHCQYGYRRQCAGQPESRGDGCLQHRRPPGRPAGLSLCLGSLEPYQRLWRDFRARCHRHLR